ncbi:MAG TPA: hypothetical protein VMZ69_08415 [Saprospiraceae bacterium]|nr:hypothetical protein [Saprospiraceae bacterium]
MIILIINNKIICNTLVIVPAYFPVVGRKKSPVIKALLPSYVIYVAWIKARIIINHSSNLNNAQPKK